MTPVIKVLIAKPGLDGHDRGALVIAKALAEAGMTVTYTGIRQTPQQIVTTALQKEVDCVGLSSLSGAHRTLFPEVVRLLQRQSQNMPLIIGGGIIPERDKPFLLSRGIGHIFTPGTTTQEVVAFIFRHARRKEDCLSLSSMQQ